MRISYRGHSFTFTAPYEISPPALLTARTRFKSIFVGTVHARRLLSTGPKPGMKFRSNELNCGSRGGNRRCADGSSSDNVRERAQLSGLAPCFLRVSCLSFQNYTKLHCAHVDRVQIISHDFFFSARALRGSTRVCFTYTAYVLFPRACLRTQSWIRHLRR